ncbi:MAG TPA: glycosyltransferase family 39 protein, partial [Chloroflexota bacterium]
ALTLLLASFLARLAWAARSARPVQIAASSRATARAAIPAAMLLLGIFQATAYILVINNATLRFWAIADGIFLGQGYPLTLTEPGPVSAGSPPYVYDLPLFPLLMRASFSLLGHTSTAAHMPALISSILFPLSLYLLLQEMTGSRTTAVIFSGLTSSFPLLRFWVLNLPDPDPFFLTGLCLAAYLYLRVAGTRRGWRSWLVAGVASGVVSLARPEGILYVAFLGLGLLITRPGLRRIAVYSAAVGAFVIPMVVVWWANYGFLWPQNYNRTLSTSFLRATLAQLDTPGGLALYPKALGIGPEWALGLLALLIFAALAGTAIAAVRKPRLLPIALPALANSLTIFFTNPWISNAFNYADFFRHAAFGIPFVVAIAGYGCHEAARWLSAKPRGSLVRALLGLLLVAAVLREGDILANPTATHRPGSPFASQALADTTYLSLEAVLENPMRLPEMQFYRDQSGALIAYVPDIKWPDAALQFFDSMDMSYDTQGRAFGYGGAVAFLLALAFAAISEGGWKRPVRAGREAATGSPSYE